ncbi:cytochrome c biogenesis heme-transporting ATPase CcmA [Pseudomaricurvus alkylphenolicus]|jgi:heme exporter protein A|uniref:cytochrome c biogenesis heme-transporting ATPase CcmA n=1 Tax=Pseudomaricurvus alkylphenolicus TaxID=1306991 RepID=UPI001424390E|nr:cytochrome c biogenesis heme-transporting ATPase CcmA [Pseudomaricurvus alkylphenolicus]NIB44525.1 cytochrome c biogenesis heme-transporting ATPase CcmA [Pseudomaricurvus alkylphenolicus]
MTQPLIKLTDLSCERDERVLFEALNLSIDAGDLVQIEGPNGCGKTTLLRLLTTTSTDYSGNILWQGEPIDRVRLDYLNQLLYVGHLPGVKKALTPRENLGWFCGMFQGHQRCSVEEALEQVGLFGFEDVPCYHLSAGQLRRVALARLFLTPARVWVLDEPFTAIDKQGVANLERLMAEHASGGGCVILTTHQDMMSEGVRRINLRDFAPINTGAAVQYHMEGS